MVNQPLSVTGEFGRFEEFFSEVIFPVWPLWAVGGVIVAGAALYFAYDRGWHQVALRHPLISGVAAVAILAVSIPTGYYLASPLFDRSLACEASPLAGADAGYDKCEDRIVAAVDPTAAPTAAPTTSPPTRPMATAAPTPQPPFEARLTHQGEFHGADDFHFGNGKVLLIETAPGQYILRFEEFSVRNGPDLYVYLSTNPEGYGDDPLELGTLKATDGAFNYDIPPGTDISRFKGALVWCKQFAVLFATAPLMPA
jgi:hypothetical protein